MKEEITNRDRFYNSLSFEEKSNLVNATILDHVFSEIEELPLEKEMSQSDYDTIVKKRLGETRHAWQEYLDKISNDPQNHSKVDSEPKRLQLLLQFLAFYFPPNQQ